MKKIIEFLKKEWFLLLVVVANFIVGWYVNPVLPDMVPIHWNIAGQVDGYGPKLMVTLGFPVIALVMYGLMLILPLIDPKRKNYSLFEGSYKLMRVLILLLFTFMYGVIIVSGLGYKLDVAKVIVFALALFFIIIGNYLGRVRQNFFVGIKTPWTLSSNEVWMKTHRAAGWIYVLTGLISIITIFFNNILTFIIIVAGTLSPIFYSYILFVRLQKKQVE